MKRNIFTLWLLTAAILVAQHVTTDTNVFIEQRNASGRNVARDILGSSNTYKALGFNGSGVLGALSLSDMLANTSAGVIVQTDYGRQTVFAPAADTDAARGTALIAAVAAMAAGDRVILAAGTYDIGTTQLILPVGSSLIGQGWGTTIIDGDKRTHNIKIATDCTIQGVKITVTTPSSSSGHSIIGNESAATSNVTIRDCHLVGEQDIFNDYGGSFSNSSIRIIGCVLQSKFDAFICGTGTGTVDFDSCWIVQDGTGNPDGSAALSGLTVRSGYTMNVRNCRIQIGIAGPGWSGTGLITSGGTMNVTDCYISTATGSTTPYDLYQSGGGTMNVTGGRGSGTNGAYLTFGTITRIGADFARFGSSIDSSEITDGTVALADMANLAQSTLVGRYTASTGVPQSITLGPEFSAASGTLVLAEAYQVEDPRITRWIAGDVDFSPLFDAGYSVSGPTVTIMPALVGGAMNLTEYGGTYNATANATLTWSGSPATGQFYYLNINGDGGGPYTITLPASIYSIYGGTTLPSVSVPANGSMYLAFRWEGARWVCLNDPADTTGSGKFVLQDNPTVNAPTITGQVVFPDGVRQVFNPNGTVAGVNVGFHASDPSTPLNGDLWYNLTSGQLKAYINGAVVVLGSGTGNVTAAADFAVTNSVIVSDGTGKGVKKTPVIIDASGNVSGIGTVDATTTNAGTLNAGSLEFDGTTADAIKTFITVQNPTGSSKSWRVPNLPSTDFVGLDSTQTLTKKTIQTEDNVISAEIGMACSDETTALTTGTAKVTFRMPYAMTLSSIRASVTTAPTGSTILVDVNEGGASILSTKLMIDASEKTSTTAATSYVVSDNVLGDDAEITIDIDQVGSTVAGTGLKIWLIGTK